MNTECIHIESIKFRMKNLWKTDLISPNITLRKNSRKTEIKIV